MTATSFTSMRVTAVVEHLAWHEDVFEICAGGIDLFGLEA